MGDLSPHVIVFEMQGLNVILYHFSFHQDLMKSFIFLTTRAPPIMALGSYKG